MTAEVAILNKSAVALAADSAVTFGPDGGQPKIYDTVNKLFTLSKHAPVGVMFFGSAEFMSIPWETLIKVYRSHLGAERFGALTDYVDDFVKYLHGGLNLVSAEQQARFVFVCGVRHYAAIRKQIDNMIQALLLSRGSLTEAAIARTAGGVIGNELESWEAAEPLGHLSENLGRRIALAYASHLNRAIDAVFEGLPVSNNAQRKLRKIVALSLTKDRFARWRSGVVIAGYGEDEIYPSLVELTMEGIVLDELKYKERTRIAIDADNAAVVTAFAQREMVDQFMQGVDPAYADTFLQAARGILNGYPDVLKDALGQLKVADRALMRGALRDAAPAVVDALRQQMRQYADARFVQPVIGSVAALPKDELAAMAESLVNLTSFKRRMSLDLETVGGPIDVAVISKGDGFVWIERKHYFKPNLNHHFFENYFDV